MKGLYDTMQERSQSYKKNVYKKGYLIYPA
jgi:hypothetical protein